MGEDEITSMAKTFYDQIKGKNSSRTKSSS